MVDVGGGWFGEEMRRLRQVHDRMTITAPAWWTAETKGACSTKLAVWFVYGWRLKMKTSNGWLFPCSAPTLYTDSSLSSSGIANYTAEYIAVVSNTKNVLT
ncbi:hypothetical protein QYF36_023849 [Acer negundo]|nr:hypothetical protein QYF36_023849 [Acer negundo]